MSSEMEPTDKNFEFSNEKDRYSIIKPKLVSWIKYGIFIIILSLGYIFIIFDPVDNLFLPDEKAFSFQIDEILLGLLLPNIAMIIITPFLWDKIGQAIINGWIKIIKNNSGKEKEKAGRFWKVKLAIVNTISIFFGIKVGPEHDYYVEVEGVNDNLNEVLSTFKDKILSAISTSIGITFIIAFIVNFLIFDSGLTALDLKSKDVLFLVVMIMQIVPFLVSFIIPLVWSFKGLLLRYTDSKEIRRDVGEEMARGILQKFIGIGGLLMGISICYDLAEQNIWATAVYFTFFFVLLNAGTVTLVSVLYLTHFHEKRVNATRKKLLEFFPLTETKSKPKLPLTVGETTQKEEEPKAGKKIKTLLQIIIVLILAGLAIFGEVYILFIVGPF